MADDLKRVGLIFKEDGAVDFKKTLQEVNIELNKNYNQFKLTQAQWDNSTKSTKKLREEQEYLKNAYEIQNDKVSTLKMQLADLENAENKNVTAIKKKRNELTAAEVKLESYNKRLKEIDNQLHNTGKKMEEWGKNVENAGKKIESAGKKLSAFSAATGAAFVASAKSAIDFEDAFAGVEKTVDGTKEQMEELKQGIRDMAQELPSTTTEISAVAEAAGQLGIKTENILDFSKAMIDLGNSTNLTSDEAASQLAKFANIMQMSQKDFNKLGSAIVDLGNNFATTEADIVSMAMRLAGAGKQVGLSEGQVLGLATALSSVGIEAEMGGSAISKAMVKMQNAVELGGDKLNSVLKKTGMSLRSLELMASNDSKGFKEMSQSIGMTSTEVKNLITAGTNLEDFAKVSGMTAEQFKKAWKKDAAGALSSFIKGLGDAEDKGESAITMLSEMGLTEVRLRDSLLRAANAGELFNDAIETGTEAWEENVALTNEANKRYDTLKSKITIAVNKLKDQAITLGNKLIPTIEKVLDRFGKWIEKFENLSDEQVDMIVKIGLMVTAIGPLVSILGKVTSTIGGTVKGIGAFTQAIGVIQGTVTTSSTAVNGLAKIISGLTSPVGLATIGITSLAGAIIYLNNHLTEEQKQIKETSEAIKEQREAYIESQKAREEALQTSISEIDNIQNLRNELSGLADENGKVKDGYEARANFILTQLNQALGTEYKLNGDIITQYDELKKSIDGVIAKKRAEIILASEEEAYKQALSNIDTYKEELADLGMTEQDYINTKVEIENLKQKMQKQTAFSSTGASLVIISNYKKEIEALENKVSSYENAKQNIGDAYTAIENYEQDYVLFTQGKAEDIESINARIVSSYTDLSNATAEELNKQINLSTTNLRILEERYNENQNQITQIYKEEEKKRLTSIVEALIAQTSAVNDNSPEIIEAWKQLATGSYSTYYDEISKMPPELGKKIQEMTGVTAERTPELVEETQKMAQSVLDEVKENKEFKKEAIKNLQAFLNGLSDEELRELLKEAGVDNAEEVIKGIRKGNLAEEEGEEILSDLKDGLDNKTWKDKLWSTARNIASTLSGLLTVKASVNGKTSTLPGHKLGLDYVPKDNYVARLHKGERVLTAEENKAYMEAEESRKKNSSNPILGSTEMNYQKMADAFSKALTNCKFTLDDDGFARIVKDELYKAV